MATDFELDRRNIQPDWVGGSFEGHQRNWRNDWLGASLGRPGHLL
jgi:hypothetical protein